MFDGSYRTKRTVNLSGNSSNSRRNRNRRNNDKKINTGINLSSTSSNKAQLLESARIERQQRRQTGLRISSALRIQRCFRGFWCRSNLVKSLRKVDKSAVLAVNDNNGEGETRYYEDEGDLVMGCMRRLGRVLSPPLLPFLSIAASGDKDEDGDVKMGHSNEREVESSSQRDTIRDKRILGMLLSIEQKIAISSQVVRPTKMTNKTEVTLSMTNMQKFITFSRIFYHCVRLLHSYLLSKTTTDMDISTTDNTYSFSKDEMSSISRLMNVVQYIFTRIGSIDVGADDDNKTVEMFLRSIWNLDNGNIVHDIYKKLHENTGALLMPSSLSTMTETSIKPDDPPLFPLKEGEVIIMAIFSCFRDWFWYSSHLQSLLLDDTRDEEDSFKNIVRCTAEKMMHWTFGVVAAARNMDILDIHNNSKEEDTYGLSVLVAILYCSSEIENLESQWSKQLKQCFLSYLDYNVEDGHNILSSESLFENLMQTLIQTLSTSSSSLLAVTSNAITSTNGQNKNRRAKLVSYTVKKILSGKRTLSFLSNALKQYTNSMKSLEAEKIKKRPNGTCSSLPTKFQVLCKSAVDLLNVILLPNESNGESNILDGDIDFQIFGVMCGLAAQGEDVISLLSSVANVKDIDINDFNKSVTTSEEENEEDEDEEEFNTIPTDTSGTVNQRQVLHKKRSTLIRQEIQTVSKLDNLYQMELMESRKEALMSLHRWMGKMSTTAANDRSSKDSYIQLMGTIAVQIGGGELLRQISSELLKRGSSTDLSTSNLLKAGQEALVRLLSYILQFCTSTKSRVSSQSPLLSKLAFQTDLVDELWDYVQHQLGKSSIFSSKKRSQGQEKCSYQALTTSTAASIFSDLYVQKLVAMDDEQFLASYSKENTANAPSSGINAEDIIITVRDILYELYWSKPVVASDVRAPSQYWSIDRKGVVLSLDQIKQRGQNVRLFLSATKLWNALYERWSRLFRSVRFCEEECWCFPLMTARDDGVNAIVMNNVDQMDIDSNDSSIVGMDINNVSGDDADETVTAETIDEDEKNEAFALFFRDPKMARILTAVPQSLPFARRAKLFSSLLRSDKKRSQDETLALNDLMRRMAQGDDDESYRGREKITIHRDTMYQDAKNQLNTLGKRCKKKIQVAFVNQHGTPEAGIDGGGLFKEFLSDLINISFDPEENGDTSMYPLFTVSSMQTLQVNTGLNPSSEVLSHYEFLGRVLGKAVYESILVEPQFCLPFLNQLLGKNNAFDDLKNVDTDTYKNLNNFRKMEAQEIDAVGSSFELTTRRTDGSPTYTVELIPGGSAVPVTKDNVLHYIHLVAYRRLNIETAAQTRAFLRGFRDLIPAAWVNLFSPYELQKVIGGDDSVKGFDVKGLQKVMEYGSGYHPSQVIIQWFWEVIEEMNAEQQRNFLKFVTSCSRQPLLGFGALNPPPCIQQIRIPDAELMDGNARLPTASTCMNLLKLPNYKTKELLKQKLLYAVQSGSGFELS